MIKRLNNLYIIGTSHIARQSINEVQDVILNHRPKVVALELDQRRFVSLMSPKRKIRLGDIKHLGIRGFLFNILGAYVEKKLGEIVNTQPGSEIKKAVECASKSGSRIALIDQDIAITLRRLTRTLTWKEKFQFLKDVLSALFHRKRKMRIDLTKVPDERIISRMTNEVRKKYPSVYKVLIEERNVYMGKALNKILSEYPDDVVVAVVGAGHVEGITKILKKHESRA